MKRWTQHNRFRAGIQEALKQGGQEEQPTEVQITDWLSDLRLLKGVPFHYLVPDQRMLPTESIRFFSLDQNWVDALIDGAFSIGRVVTGDHVRDKKYLDRLRKKILTKAACKRSGQQEGEPVEASGQVTGFLLRSAVVPGWPQLEVRGSDDSGEAKLLRMERLSTDIMLCLFDRLVTKVRFSEPAEALHFGVEQGITPLQKLLKYVQAGPNGEQPGSVIKDVHAMIPMRDATTNNQVIDIQALAGDIHQLLIDNQGISSSAPFTAAEFALEMIQGVQEVDYLISNPQI
ncbi:hypothetical protein [Arachidicoccus terrestris]|uniref:hypothetical protein n=1 Tax=Arachidicoccus terrestris TaxID=2875539 RepID=UPI001CC5E314|nr:hypothetical protein [Arachidicoccus terrestris]UAY54337.1 hypothetical protein K9M52_12845 [Arachidicoccus terrestris]